MCFQLKSITHNTKAQKYLNHPHQNQQEVTEDEDFWNNLHISMEEHQSERIWQPNCKSMNKKTLQKTQQENIKGTSPILFPKTVFHFSKMTWKNTCLKSQFRSYCPVEAVSWEESCSTVWNFNIKWLLLKTQTWGFKLKSSSFSLFCRRSGCIILEILI